MSKNLKVMGIYKHLLTIVKIVSCPKYCCLNVQDAYKNSISIIIIAFQKEKLIFAYFDFFSLQIYEYNVRTKTFRK